MSTIVDVIHDVIHDVSAAAAADQVTRMSTALTLCDVYAHTPRCSRGHSANDTEKGCLIGTGSGRPKSKQRDWDEVGGEKQGVGFRDKVKHYEGNDQLLLTTMLLLVDE